MFGAVCTSVTPAEKSQRYYIWKDAQAKAHSELWDDPQGYYFCNIVTVLPYAALCSVKAIDLVANFATAVRPKERVLEESSSRKLRAKRTKKGKGATWRAREMCLIRLYTSDWASERSKKWTVTMKATPAR